MPIEKYESGMATEWDRFVFERSVNGNFLQSRRFLSYHPEGRFGDCSLVYRDNKGNLRAVIPAAARSDNRGRTFVSHPGSTYGGLVVDAKTCSAHRMLDLIGEIDAYLEREGFAAATLKLPPDFMWVRDEAALMEYLLISDGWNEICELTTFIDFERYDEPTLKNFSQGKRTNVNNCLKKGLVAKPIEADDPAVARLHEILCANLERHGAKPVHTLEELKLLAGDILQGKSELLGVFDGDRLIAGGWAFIFDNQQVVHTQYLCADDDYAKLSPMTFLYYSVIERYRERGYRAVSWGISTEEHGRVLNMGLTESKESFGSVHGVHRTFEKAFNNY